MENVTLKEAFKLGNLELLCVLGDGSECPFMAGQTYSVLEPQEFLDSHGGDDSKVAWHLNYYGTYCADNFDYVADLAKRENIPQEEFDITLELMWWEKGNDDESYSPAFFIYRKKKLSVNIPFDYIKGQVMELNNADLWALKMDIEEEIKRRFLM